MNSIIFIAERDYAIILLGVAIFGCVAAAAWWVADSFFDNETRSESRLDELRNRRGVTDTKDDKKSGIAKLLESATPAVSEAVGPKNEKEVNKLKEKLDSAGFRHDSCLLYTSPSPRDRTRSRMPSSA